LVGKRWRPTDSKLNETETLFCHGQRSNPFSSCREYGIGNRWNGWRQGWFTEACWRIVCLEEVHFDYWRLRHS
jgi:hypothetical protein